MATRVGVRRVQSSTLLEGVRRHGLRPVYDRSIAGSVSWLSEEGPRARKHLHVCTSHRSAVVNPLPALFEDCVSVGSGSVGVKAYAFENLAWLQDQTGKRRVFVC